MVVLNPEGCCCADETLGVETEAVLAFISQGFSGVEVAICSLLAVCNDLGVVSADPSSQTEYFGTEFRIMVQGVSCEKDGDPNRSGDRNGKRGPGGPRHSSRTE